MELLNIKFPNKLDVLMVHATLIAETGGINGLRDEGLFESALDAAENRHRYEAADALSCAAAYAYHLTQAHAFVDGNKRTAIVAAGAFLIVNGHVLTADNGTLYEFVMAVASGEIDEAGSAAFSRDHIVKLEN